VAAFLGHHEGVSVVMHNAPFDLSVIALLAPGVDVYRWVDRDAVRDTQLLHRLLTLGTEGRTAAGKGQSTLEHCVDRYLGATLPKDTVDSKGEPIRLSYGQWLNRPPNEIEPVYLEYLAKDALVTMLLFDKLEEQLQQLMAKCSTARGYVSEDWLQNQICRWGWQTHHTQLKAAIVLKAITANGLHVDVERGEELGEQLAAVADEHRAVLREHGYIPNQQGSGKALQEIMRRLDAKHFDLYFPRTASGKYGTSREALEQLAGVELFIDSLLAFKEVEKLLSTYVKRLGRNTLHPSFDPLKVTGRTSSHGEINAQNLPRDDRIRSCFIPPPGHVFIDADYSTVEMATLAQTVLTQFDMESQMADAINGGTDLHRLVAARVLGKDVGLVTKAERQKAKAINFGKPGGMGHGGLKSYAKASYGVDLSDAEVDELSDAWFALFPEMEDFLENDLDVPLEVAEFLCLTPSDYHAYTGSRKFLNHPENVGKAHKPNPIMSAMCIKTIGNPDPKTKDGKPYDAATVDYLWSQLAEAIDDMPSEHHQAIRDRKPSKRLQRALINRADRGGVITATGRLRARASYCERRNTIFQGLAADGAKLGLWHVWRAGYHIVNFIHDELLVAVPTGSNVALHAAVIRHLMLKGMRAVVPDVHVDVEYAVTDRWYKGGEMVFGDDGKLDSWSAPAVAA